MMVMVMMWTILIIIDNNDDSDDTIMMMMVMITIIMITMTMITKIIMIMIINAVLNALLSPYRCPCIHVFNSFEGTTKNYPLRSLTGHTVHGYITESHFFHFLGMIYIYQITCIRLTINCIAMHVFFFPTKRLATLISCFKQYNQGYNSPDPVSPVYWLIIDTDLVHTNGSSMGPNAVISRVTVVIGRIYHAEIQRQE